MKFGEYLRKNLTSEWSSQYIQYEDMKEILYEFQSKAPLINEINQNLLRQQYFIDADQEFFQFCEKELTKINTFFAEKLAESLLRFDFLKNEFEYIERNGEDRHLTVINKLYKSDQSDLNLSNENNKMKLRESISKIRLKRFQKHEHIKLNDFKLGLSEFYLMLIILKNYQTLNFNGFCKILKKHDKLFETNRGYQWRMLYIANAPFYKSIRVDELINEVENFYTNKLANGNRSRAMERLRVPPLEEKHSSLVTFRLGISLGMILILIPLLILLTLLIYNNKLSKEIDWRAGLHLYRSSFLIIFHMILFGINVYGWSINGVNHILIFEIDPRNHLTYEQILEISTFLMVLWLISLNLFFLLFYYNIYPFIQPLCLTILLILILINPFKIFYKNSRYWFLKKLFRVFIAPYYRVDFVDFWLADQFCSLEIIFFDLEYFICFYVNENNLISSQSIHSSVCNGSSQIILQSFFQFFPSWFRFAQCLRRYYSTKEKFPHLINAGKYFSTLFVIITNALRRFNNFDYHQNKYENPFLYLWILTSLISSIYKFIWDIKMDWGFFQKNSNENKYLRQQIIYEKKFYYYAAILINFFFRFIWIINIFIHFNSLFGEYSDITGFSFAFIEIVRRFIWNYFRLENEHLNNCGQFRAVRDISIRPTHNFNQNNLQQNQNDNTIITINNEIPMTTMNHEQNLTNYSLIRRKTNAEEFIDEINNLLTNNIN
ncbi:unnamed protein product [Adineta steineri]|uniref:Xenotropic and polytropic retrovirus receptor 1-like protein n=1 Tax=Adineta steineri TaxID=433720 RepID=A0A815JRX6_9BILA|nr:unnamed protein product [Adineta steineri]CAF3839910.1 unnamed protein product [Adineta steineri]